ncbi:MAG: Mth938-like domain-containing protein [Pseudomonadota bacterium]
MRMIEIDYEARPPVDGYGPGGFRLGGVWQAGSVILLPEVTLSFAGVITVEAMAPVLDAAGTLDVLLIGMGDDVAPLPRDVRTSLDEAEIGLDLMSTPSACRTYNVLLTEDRRVAAVLTAV